MTEDQEAIVIANRVLDRVSADPDDDIAILARQLLRRIDLDKSAVHDLVFRTATASLKIGAPGLSETGREAIAVNLAVKISTLLTVRGSELPSVTTTATQKGE